MHDPVSEQVDAYNAQDIDRFCACYHDDVVIEDGDGTVRSTGIETMRIAYGSMFARYPDIRAEILSRIRIGPWVIDEERVTGRTAEPMRAIAIYRVRDGKIASVRFLTDGLPHR